ncbi:MAG: YicC/YloC family endoribonuclease [Longimicrobiales bacterium]
MIRSMTGYGEAERETDAGRLRVEVRTVNHRFFSANVRTPSGLDRFDVPIQNWLRAFLPRGHVNVAVRLESDAGDGGPALQLNEARARQYHRVLLEMKERLGLAGQVDLDMLSRVPSLIEPAEAGSVELDADSVRTAVEDAARAVVLMREGEGRRLQADLEARLEAIDVAVDAVVERAPERLRCEHDRLRRAVAELAGDVGVDEDRLAREIAFLAERWDIGEEVVRLRSHLELFRDILESDDTEPVGKRLGFLVQEMHREANTVGSKANDAAIEHEVVAIKNEIERLREQVDNVE